MFNAEVTVNAPLKRIFPVVFVSVTVFALTAPEKVAPPELVKVTVPMSVPIAPDTETAPVVFKVKFDALPAAVPVTELKLIGAATPVPTVNVVPSAKVAAPKVICPVEDPPTVELAVTLIGVLRLITPVPAAETVPAKLILEGAVAITPPVKAELSVASLPKVSVPVFAKVVAPAILLFAPVSEMLYALAVPAALMPVLTVKLFKKAMV